MHEQIAAREYLLEGVPCCTAVSALRGGENGLALPLALLAAGLVK